MREMLAAFTAAGSSYPEYLNFSRDGDDVIVTARATPTVRDGVYVCAHARDAGPGRCVAGGPTCNNYCNMAPEKGLMADRPLSCTHVSEGATVSVRIPEADFASILASLESGR